MAREVEVTAAVEVEVQCECGEWLDVKLAYSYNGVITIEVCKCEACAKVNNQEGYADGLAVYEEA